MDLLQALMFICISNLPQTGDFQKAQLMGCVNAATVCVKPGPRSGSRECTKQIMEHYKREQALKDKGPT